MYKEVKVHIPKEFHEKLKSLLVQDKPFPVKISLIDGEDVLLLTPGQIIKMENAKKLGKKTIIFRFSQKQIRANIKHEGGFLTALMSMATKVLPTLLTGLASGVIGGLAEKAISKGSGLYLGKRGRGVSQIHLVEGGGLYLSPLFYPKEYHDGLYMTHEDKMYKGSGLILGKDSPFRNIPVLGWLL